MKHWYDGVVVRSFGKMSIDLKSISLSSRMKDFKKAFTDLLFWVSKKSDVTSEK